MGLQRLDAVTAITMGQAPEGESYNLNGEGLPLIAGAGDFGELHPEAKKFTTAPGKTCQAGDIILGIRATIGEKVVADGTYCLGRGVAGIRPRAGLDARYLWHWLTHATPSLAVKAKGATFKQVNREDIGGLPISPPPLPEQRRIAEILDRADALRARRRATLAQIDTLTQSIFLDMFGDPATNPKGWPRKTIGEIGEVVTGNTPSRANPKFYGGSLEWLKSDTLGTGAYFATRAKETLSEQGRARARIAPPGAILVTCIAGSESSIGKAAMLDREAAFNQQINSVVVRVGNPHFAFAQVRCAQSLIQSASTASMKGMVSKSRFEGVQLIWPPTELQDKFVGHHMKLEQIKELALNSLAQFDALVASLQHRAFCGVL